MIIYRITDISVQFIFGDESPDKLDWFESSLFQWSRIPGTFLQNPVKPSSQIGHLNLQYKRNLWPLDTFGWLDADTSPNFCYHWQEALRIAAEAHLRQCRCRNKAGEPWPLWSTMATDLQEYGTGISLYFRFTISLGTAMLFAALVTLPLLLLNSTGTGLNDVDVGTGEPGVFALTSIGNFLSSTDGSISLSRFDITPADISFLALAFMFFGSFFVELVVSFSPINVLAQKGCDVPSQVGKSWTFQLQVFILASWML